MSDNQQRNEQQERYTTLPVEVNVNGRTYRREIEPRLLLSDFLRHTLGLTGTHVGCEHGICGACTIMVDGDSVRACLMLAVQADGCKVETVESLGTMDNMNPLQEAFHSCHGLQCGFCTPGMLMTCTDMLKKYPLNNDHEIRDGLSGNLCRCTGYTHIVDAVRLVKQNSIRIAIDHGSAASGASDGGSGSDADSSQQARAQDLTETAK